MKVNVGPIIGRFQFGRGATFRKKLLKPPIVKVWLELHRLAARIVAHDPMEGVQPSADRGADARRRADRGKNLGANGSARAFVHKLVSHRLSTAVAEDRQASCRSPSRAGDPDR